MRFGAHVSAAGGLFNGPKNGATLGCEVIQIFSSAAELGGQGDNRRGAGVSASIQSQQDRSDVHSRAVSY